MTPPHPTHPTKTSKTSTPTQPEPEEDETPTMSFEEYQKQREEELAAKAGFGALKIKEVDVASEFAAPPSVKKTDDTYLKMGSGKSLRNKAAQKKKETLKLDFKIKDSNAPPSDDDRKGGRGGRGGGRGDRREGGRGDGERRERREPRGEGGRGGRGGRGDRREGGRGGRGAPRGPRTGGAVNVQSLEAFPTL